MKPSRSKLNPRMLTVVWILLLVLTAGSFWISDADRGAMAASAYGVLGLAMLKAHLVAGVFMEMIHAPRVWALLMSGFLIVLGGTLIVLLS